jgi:hypothetical protein
MTDLAQHIAKIARLFWGRRTGRSRAGRTAVGKKGARAVNLNTGQWFCHSECVGGGVVDLIRREAPGVRVSDWLRNYGIDDGDRPRRSARFAWQPESRLPD